MSEAIERVANAIGDVLSRDSTGECLLCSNERQRTELARAAIGALREPTAEMWRAEHPIWSLGRPMWDWWRQMIDEALK